MKVVKMISFEDAEGRVESLGGLGGFFSKGMRWRDYISCFSEKIGEYAEAFRQYVLENEIKHGGDWHQSNEEGVPLFSDGTVGTFSYRAWGDIMAAIWSEEEGVDYEYMDFYMERLMQKDCREV